MGGGGTCSDGMSDGGAEVAVGGGAMFTTVVGGVAVVASGIFFGCSDGWSFSSYGLWKRIVVVVCRRHDDGCGVVGGLLHRVCGPAVGGI